MDLSLGLMFPHFWVQKVSLSGWGGQALLPALCGHQGTVPTNPSWWFLYQIGQVSSPACTGLTHSGRAHCVSSGCPLWVAVSCPMLCAMNTSHLGLCRLLSLSPQGLHRVPGCPSLHCGLEILPISQERPLEGLPPVFSPVRDHCPWLPHAHVLRNIVPLFFICTFSTKVSKYTSFLHKR